MAESSPKSLTLERATGQKRGRPLWSARRVPYDRGLEESLGTSNQAVMTEEPAHKITGYAGVVRIRFPVQPDGKRPMCTGWILGRSSSPRAVSSWRLS